MKHAHLIDKLDEPRMLAAIARAEEKTTGLIRVMISKRSCPDALAAAKRHFKALKLDRSPHRNAVLIFIAPKSQTFAIYGDAGIHARGGQDFWSSLRDEMASRFKAEQFTDAVVDAIEKAGNLLARDFPREDLHSREA